MSYHEAIIQHINRISPLAVDEEHALLDKLQLKKLRRRQYLLNEGDTCTSYSFVLEGCLRMFFVDDKGTEHVLQFASENWWIADIASFHSERPSRFYIEALEPSIVLQIKRDDLYSLYTQYSVFDRYFRVLVENAFTKMQDRVIQNISSSAETRYDYFLENYTHLLNRLSQIQIASFIGITPEFLSKIRKHKGKQH